MKPLNKTSRRHQILECLAKMLETSPGERITTAMLAKDVGVSEAALYRHFPSKSKMFEGLIELIEDTLFPQIAGILAEEHLASKRCEKLLNLLLTFAESNPGLTRLLTGDALTGETERLRIRVTHIFDRIETQLKQILRQTDLGTLGLDAPIAITAATNLLMGFISGRLAVFVRTEFRQLPTEYWDRQWKFIEQGILKK